MKPHYPANAKPVMVNIAHWQDGIDPTISKTWSVRPDIPFRPMGLMIFDPTPETYVHSIRVGNASEINIGYPSIPARYFEVGHSFEKLIELSKQGELETVIPDRLWFPMQTCPLGGSLGLVTTGQFSDAVLWGLTESRPTIKTIIDRRPDDAFQARVVRESLADNSDLFEAIAPTEDACVDLVCSFFESHLSDNTRG